MYSFVGKITAFELIYYWCQHNTLHMYTNHEFIYLFISFTFLLKRISLVWIYCFSLNLLNLVFCGLFPHFRVGFFLFFFLFPKKINKKIQNFALNFKLISTPNWIQLNFFFFLNFNYKNYGRSFVEFLMIIFMFENNKEALMGRN